MAAPDDMEPIPGGKFAGDLRDMQDREFCLSERYVDQQARADRNGADPRILEFEKKLVSRLKKMGVPVFAHCVYRSDEEQNSLFVRGHSKAKAGQSPHQYGMAVDIIHGTKGWELTRKQWEIIAHVGDEIARSIGVHIRWGGDWDGDRTTTHDQWDPAHFELQDWKIIKESRL